MSWWSTWPSKKSNKKHWLEWVIQKVKILKLCCENVFVVHLVQQIKSNKKHLMKRVTFDFSWWSVWSMKFKEHQRSASLNCQNVLVVHLVQKIKSNKKNLIKRVIVACSWWSVWSMKFEEHQKSSSLNCQKVLVVHLVQQIKSNKEHWMERVVQSENF